VFESKAAGIALRVPAGAAEVRRAGSPDLITEFVNDKQGTVLRVSKMEFRTARQLADMKDIDGTKNANRLYRASSDALAFDLAEGKEATDPTVRDAFAAVRDAQLMLLPVAEAAFVGFIVACGLDPNKHYHYEEVDE
jgi:hypothetical protein